MLPEATEWHMGLKCRIYFTSGSQTPLYRFSNPFKSKPKPSAFCQAVFPDGGEVHPELTRDVDTVPFELSEKAGPKPVPTCVLLSPNWTWKI